MADPHAHDHPGFDVQVERTGPCLATVRFTVTAEEYGKARRRGLVNLARHTKMKGFRPGKVPPGFLEKRFGEQVDRELVEHFVQHALEHAVQDDGLRLAATPRVDLGKVEASPDADWGHEFEVLLRPEVELGEIEGLAVQANSTAVSDEEVDEALASLRRELSTPEPAGDEGLQEGGMAVCSLAFLRPDAEEPVIERDGLRLGPKTPLRGVDEEAYEAAMTGVKDGETRELPLAYPEDFPVEEVRGSEGTVRITVDQCFRIVEATDEQMRAELGVEDEDGLRAEVVRRIGEAKERQERQRIEHELLDRVLRDHPIEIPEPLVEDQVDAKASDLARELESQGVQGEELATRLEEERARFRETTARALRAIYLMEEIARQKDLRVTQEDFEAEFRAIAERNAVDPAEVRKYYREERLFQQLALELLERKVRSFLRESADIRRADAPAPGSAE